MAGALQARPGALAGAPRQTATQRAPDAEPITFDVQTGLPKLAIAGGVYSANPSHRMLIINGQVFREGAEPMPGLRLEQIRPSAAVLNFRGRRYSVTF